MEDVKVELGKTPVDKKNIKRMYERMHAALGDPQAPGLGSFRRRFIQVRDGRLFEITESCGDQGLYLLVH